MMDELEGVDGIIHSIRMRNFFCHENLEINFNENTNFIVGRNGSGKSAILAALVVGLGSRASVTNRGNNLNAFIKKGTHSATVEIKLKNSAKTGYKYHLYGDSITIVRHLTTSGRSNYKIKSHSGKVISTKFEEVNSIVLAFDIQVDNPISVLNQDDARSFHASDASKKYALFRKATNLDQTEINYNTALENCKNAKSIWKKKFELSQLLEKDLKKWEATYQALLTRDEIKQQGVLLKQELAWSEVKELEDVARDLQSKFDKQNIMVQKLREKINTIDDGRSVDTTLQTLKQSLQENTAEAKKIEEELKSIEQQQQEKQLSLRRLEKNLNKFTHLEETEKKTLKEYEGEIDRIKTSTEQGQRRAVAERDVKMAQARASEVAARHDTAAHHERQADEHKTRAQLEHEKAQQALCHARVKLKNLQSKLSELQGTETNALGVYGRKMIELVDKIKHAVARRQFSKPPRGPVGSYIKVKDSRWAGALDNIVGRSALSFCVESVEDAKRMFEIMKEVYGTAPKPNVSCSKFITKVHDVSANKVAYGSHKCAIDLIEVSDPIVANFLIDNVGLETILLVPEHDDAVSLTDSEENVPRNCGRVVTLDASEYYPAPNYRVYGGAGRPARYLQASATERIKQLSSELDAAALEVESSERACAEAARVDAAAARAHGQALRELRALQDERHECEGQLRAAHLALELLLAPRLNSLEQETNIVKGRLVSIEHELAEARTEHDQLTVETKRAQSRALELNQKLEALTAQMTSLNEEIGQMQLKHEQTATMRRKYADRLHAEEEKCCYVKNKLDSHSAKVETKVNEALKLCPRIENPRDTNEIRERIKKNQSKMNALQLEGLSKEEVAEKVTEARERYNHIVKSLERISKVIDEVHVTATQHLKYCLQVQTYIARRVQFCFQAILSMRGYFGRMEIDHGNAQLQLYCTGRDPGDVRAASSTSSLSGGERSYTTVAFIMALWECVALPFYFLDEFDVFMDKVNRKIIMDILIDHALRNKHRQFVFLTPQDASTVKAGPQLKIHKMADPR